MLPIMIYFLLIACLLGAAALVTERILTQMGRERRSLWLAALIASVALPGYSLLASRGAGPTLEAVPVEATPTAAAQAEADLSADGANDVPPFALPDWSRWPLFGAL
jgi:hypothetical protein